MSIKPELIKATSYDSGSKSTMNVLMKSDCRKFAPNIFNKSKCQNCFKTKDAHSAEALECNRATRKIAKCGYLFVAPDWDFSISINRTKRWQRRWFVLYDDGELTYSVDEHPNTIPQALIDMNKVLEVSDAEQLTGNQYSLAIRALDRVHFVKGTSRDETKWWYDLLSHYSHGTVRGRLKRNATFPIPTSVNNNINNNNNNINVLTDLPEKITTEISNNFNESISNNNNINNKHLSSGVELEWRPLVSSESSSIESKDILNTGQATPSKKLQPIVPDNNKSEEIENLNNLIISSLTSLPPKKMVSDVSQEQENVVPKENKIDNISKNPEKLTPEGDKSLSRSRRYVKRESRGLRSQRSRSDGVAKMIPASANVSTTVSGSSRTSRNIQTEPNIIDCQEWASNCHQNPLYFLPNDNPGFSHLEYLGKEKSTDASLPLTGHRRRHASSGQELVREHRTSEQSKKQSSRDVLLGEHSSKKNSPINSPLLIRRHSFNRKIRASDDAGEVSFQNVTESTPKRGSSLSRNNSLRKDKELNTSLLRGDPDGCLPNLSLPSPEVQIDAKDGSIEKTGWLFRYGIHKEWFKHWFVLKNSMLCYFRDPSAEVSGIMDGVLDLGLVKDVQELASDTNHSFTITTWDNKKHILAASKAAIRSDWVRSIAAAANLRAKTVFRDEDREAIIQDIESLNKKLASHLEAEKDDKCQDGISLPDCSSSTSSDDHSEYFSVVDEDDLAERASSPKALPPSPPVNRTAISRVKQKARSRSSSRSRSRRKLRSSSDLGSSSNFHSGGSNNGDEVDATIVPDERETKLTETKEAIILKSSSQNLLATAQFESSNSTGEKSSGSYRNLLNKYNFLTNDLDFCKSDVFDEKNADRALACANDALVENIFKLMKDCKSFLSRLRETLKAKNEGEIRLPIMELSLQWKEIKSVCTKLDSILRKLSGGEDVNGIPQVSDSDLSQMVEKAREEIRRLKKDLKASQDSFDDLELHCYKLKQDMKNADDLHKSHMSLMTARVDDLTSKLTASERSLRLAKQRVAKLEARQERRRSSLKGKEAVSLSKEFEGKLSELEQKIGSIETSLRSNQSDICEGVLEEKIQKEHDTNCSIDASATGMLLRLHSLHSKVNAASATALELNSSATSSPPNELVAETTSPTPLNPIVLPLEKPKICLQVKGGGLDENGSTVGTGEDAIENWSSLSVTTSMSDLHTIEPDEEPPGNLEECLNVLSQKLDILLGWLQSSVRNMANEAEDSISIGNLPDDQILAAKMLEDYLSAQMGSDESLTSSFSYLSLLRQAVLIMNSVVQPESSKTEANSQSMKIRLKKLAKAIEQNLKIDSDYENSIHLLEELILVKAEDLNSENYFEYSENVIENLRNFKEWKIEEVLLPKTYCEVPVKDSDFSSHEDDSNKIITSIPLDRVRSNAECFLDGFLKGDNLPSDKSKDKIMILIDLELNLLKKELDKKMGELDTEDVKEDIENVAVVGILERLMSYVLNHVGASIKIEDKLNLYSAILSLIESLVSRWSLQLLAKNLTRVSLDSKKKMKEISQMKRKIQCLEDEEERRKLEPCATCRDLQKQVCRLQTDLRACQRRMGQGGVPCERCRELHRRMEILSERHQMELASSLEREREEHREEMRDRIAELTLAREVEKNNDREEVAKLKRDLKTAQNQAQILKEQFDEQLTSLKEAYEEKINLSERSVEFIGEAVLQKYQTEMEDLKGLCEKGLQAVDRCHRQEFLELTQKQRREIDCLKAEKERVLAEETQATATVVEALKRSHREELQRELAKLREELIHHVETPKDSNLDEIKREILQLSEKYSKKCIEHSALEEKLNILSQQLQQTNHQMLDLLARNRQLHAHVSSDLTEKRDSLQNLSSSNDPESLERLKKLLELKETELVAEREEKARVNQQLLQARNDLAQQDIRCRQLDQGLRMQRRLWLGQAGALKNRLEAIAANNPIDNDDYRSRILGYKGYLTSNLSEDRIRMKPRRTTSFTSLAPRELLRSPSCPGLNTESVQYS